LVEETVDMTVLPPLRLKSRRSAVRSGGGDGGGDEGHAQQPDHLAVPKSVGAGLAAVQVLEVRILEQVQQGGVVQITMVVTVEIRNSIVTQLGHNTELGFCRANERPVTPLSPINSEARTSSKPVAYSWQMCPMKSIPYCVLGIRWNLVSGRVRSIVT